jgi:plastocyanin
MVVRRHVALLALLVCLPLLLIGAAIALGASPHRRVRIGPGAPPRRACHARRAEASRCHHHTSANRPGASSPQSIEPTLTTPTAPQQTQTNPGAAPPPVEESSPEPPSVPHVQVAAVEYHYTLSRTSVPAGKVVIQFVDKGEDEHNLNVDSAEGMREAEFPDTPSKGIVNQTVVLKAGTYRLFCSLPGHEQKGMKAALTVE